MSAKNSAEHPAFLESFSNSRIFSFCLVLFIFLFSLLLLSLPRLNLDLPEISKEMEIQHDVFASFSFDVPDLILGRKNYEEYKAAFPDVYCFDDVAANTIRRNFHFFIDEVKRRSECELAGLLYVGNPDLSREDAKIVDGVKSLSTGLFNLLTSIADDETRCGEFYNAVNRILLDGIISDYERSNSGENQKCIIVDSQNRRSFPKNVRDLFTPEDASDRMIDYTVSISDTRIYGKELDLVFTSMFGLGNLSFSSEKKGELLDVSWKKEPLSLTNPVIHIRENEQILQCGSTVNDYSLMIYTEYAKLYRESVVGVFTFSNLFPKISLSLILLIFSCIYVENVHPEVIRNNHSVMLITFIIVLSLVCNRVFVEVYQKVIPVFDRSVSVKLCYVLPLAIPSLIISAIYGGRTALFAGLYVSGVSAIALGNSFETVLTGLFVSGVCAISVRRVYDYSHFLWKAILASSITTIICSLFFKNVAEYGNYFKNEDWNQLGIDIAVPFATGIASAVVAAFSIMLLDWFRSIASNMSFLTMTSRDHALLKRLQMEAPGTYHHSERVALLAEKAAVDIGAKAMKVQAYALFHDIGKINNPTMFTENDPGKKAHKNLSPQESAAIIRKHVEDGVRTAKHWGLKVHIQRAIQQHHGDDLILYFYDKEYKRTGTVPDRNDFAYKGPLPEEKEIAILMLADCCEAAMASIREPDENAIRECVQDIIVGKIRRHQLDNSRLTMRELAMIRDSFIKSFVSMGHTRIVYQIDPEVSGDTSTRIALPPVSDISGAKLPESPVKSEKTE